MTTMNKTPVSAATGTNSITFEAATTKIKNMVAAKAVDNLPMPPDFTLIVLCPIIASPPIDLNRPLMRFATPCATHSCVHLPVASEVSSKISSTSCKVKTDSINPTAAKENIKGATIPNDSRVKSTSGV